MILPTLVYSKHKIPLTYKEWKGGHKTLSFVHITICICFRFMIAFISCFTHVSQGVRPICGRGTFTKFQIGHKSGEYRIWSFGLGLGFPKRIPWLGCPDRLHTISMSCPRPHTILSWALGSLVSLGTCLENECMILFHIF